MKNTVCPVNWNKNSSTKNGNYWCISRSTLRKRLSSVWDSNQDALCYISDGNISLLYRFVSFLLERTVSRSWSLGPLSRWLRVHTNTLFSKPCVVHFYMFWKTPPIKGSTDVSKSITKNTCQSFGITTLSKWTLCMPQIWN